MLMLQMMYMLSIVGVGDSVAYAAWHVGDDVDHVCDVDYILRFVDEVDGDCVDHADDAVESRFI